MRERPVPGLRGVPSGMQMMPTRKDQSMTDPTQEKSAHPTSTDASSTERRARGVADRVHTATGAPSGDDLTLSFGVDRSPAEVFAAVNDVRAWWTGDITGPTDELGAEFTYQHGDVHRSTQRVVELAPGARVVWLVTEAHLAFAEHPDEWVGTTVVFDLEPRAGGTEVRFTHHGLTPDLDCYDGCSLGWRHFVGAVLPDLLGRS